MKDLEVIKYLIKEIEEEQDRKERYRVAIKKAEHEAQEKNKNKLEGEQTYYSWEFIVWNEPLPSEALIKENLKKIRRICLKMY